MQTTWQQICLFTAIIIMCCSAARTSYANTGEPYDYYEPAPVQVLDEIEEYHLPQAIAQLGKGQYEFAWGEFSFVLHYFPNHPRALQAIADLSLLMERPERAMSLFDRAIRLYPQIAATHQIYGSFLRKANRPALAAKQYEKALLLGETSADLHYNLGLTYSALQQWEKANEQAQLAYRQGYPLDGLREQLIMNNAWSEQ